MANKFYQVKKTINGVEYTAQFNGLSAAMRAADETYIDGTEITSVSKTADYILNNVIVDPKVTVDDFDTVDELNDVLAFGRGVMEGKFREQAINTTNSKNTSKA